MHAIQAPRSFPAPVGDGTCLLHLDPQPENVLLTADSDLERVAAYRLAERELTDGERGRVQRRLAECSKRRASNVASASAQEGGGHEG